MTEAQERAVAHLEKLGWRVSTLVSVKTGGAVLTKEVDGHTRYLDISKTGAVFGVGPSGDISRLKELEPPKED